MRSRDFKRASGKNLHTILPHPVSETEGNSGKEESPIVLDSENNAVKDGKLVIELTGEAPPTGLEPVTRWLTATCSTN